MNNNILALAERCGYVEGVRWATEDFDVELFAELIVLECCEQTREWSNDHYSIDITKAHFGINEQ